MAHNVLYSSYGINEFVIALGYKSSYIKEYFAKKLFLSSDLSIDFSTNSIKQLKPVSKNWKITLVDTGISSMTGGRILNARKYFEGETFMCTYGDGLSDVDLNHLLKYHQSKSSVATVTSVRPPARFGEILADDKGYVSFREKPQTYQVGLTVFSCSSPLFLILFTPKQFPKDTIENFLL